MYVLIFRPIAKLTMDKVQTVEKIISKIVLRNIQIGIIQKFESDFFPIHFDYKSCL